MLWAMTGLPSAVWEPVATIALHASLSLASPLVQGR